MIDVKDVPEILSLGINAPLPFSGVVSSPFYVKTDDLSSPLARCEELIMEAIEDGFQLSDDRLAEKLKFEFGAGVTAAGGGVGVLCLVILNIAENDLINYMASGDLAPGEIRNKALIQRLNKFSPGLGVSKVVLVPHLKDVA